MINKSNRVTIVIATFVAGLILFIKQIVWLSIILFLFAFMQMFFIRWRYSQTKKNRFLYFPFRAIVIILIVFSIRIFFFEIYYIPSKSMERTLITGDVILLNKLILGPRLPRYYREIPWCSTLFCLIKTNPEVNRRLKWRNIRLSGFRDISRGDILVFNLPKYENQTIVKRCVGLPGEMIYVKNNEVYINHKASDPLAKEVSNYRLFQTNKKDFPCITDNSRKYDSFLYRDSLDICISYLDLIQLGVEQVYNKYKILDNGSKVIDNHFKKGDKDNYPEIQIPFKGLELELNEKNKIKYQPMLSKYEGLEWNKEFKEYLYNGKVVKNHIFKNNYYFMMGDNRTKSIDSRYWGAVPEELIIGMATNVLWNINKSDD